MASFLILSVLCQPSTLVIRAAIAYESDGLRSDKFLQKHSLHISALLTDFLCTVPFAAVLSVRKFLLSYKSMWLQLSGKSVFKYSSTIPWRSSLSIASICSLNASLLSCEFRYKGSPCPYRYFASAHICRTSSLVISHDLRLLCPVTLIGQKRRLPVISRRNPVSELVVPTIMHCLGWLSIVLP